MFGSNTIEIEDTIVYSNRTDTNIIEVVTCS